MEMKIGCDVCDNGEASLYCVADEAALCAACDHRVHHVNSLARKHRRFSLHQQPPLCDICQERRAFLFCAQDRAVLCGGCDIAIHKANEHTQRHTRFLLTGVKISATCSEASNAPDSIAIPNVKSRDSKHRPPNAPSTSKGNAPESCERRNPHRGIMNEGKLIDRSSVSASSSVSEYFVETLPGWHVEDLLDSPFLSRPYGISKNGSNGDHVLSPELECSNNIKNSIKCEHSSFLVPSMFSSFNF